MCKEKKTQKKIKANSCGCSMSVIMMPNTLCMEKKEYLYIRAFNNNSAILTFQFLNVRKINIC